MLRAVSKEAPVRLRQVSAATVSHLQKSCASNKPTAAHPTPAGDLPENRDGGTKSEHQSTPPAQPKDPKPRKKTIAELDEEMRQKMSGIAGDGGEAGVEYEDGKPVAMKRSVRENMFRYI